MLSSNNDEKTQAAKSHTQNDTGACVYPTRTPALTETNRSHGRAGTL